MKVTIMEIILLLLLVGRSLSFIPVVLGQHENHKKVDAKPDPYSEYTLISSFDFVCTAEFGCEVVSGFKKLIYNGKVISYLEVNVAIEFDRDRLGKKTKVYYFQDGPNGIGSILGLRKESGFLQSIAESRRDGGIEFWVDDKDNIFFAPPRKSSDSEFSFVEMDYKMQTQFQFEDSTIFKSRELRMCMQVPIDSQDDQPWFYIDQSLYDDLVAQVQKRTFSNQYDDRGLSIFLSPGDSSKVLPLSYNQLYHEEKPQFKPIKSDGTECDVYPGRKLYNQFGYQYRYVQVRESYTVSFGVNATQDPKYQKNESSFLSKLFVWVILGAAFYFIYKLYLLRMEEIKQRKNQANKELLLIIKCQPTKEVNQNEKAENNVGGNLHGDRHKVVSITYAQNKTGEVSDEKRNSQTEKIK